MVSVSGTQPAAVVPVNTSLFVLNAVLFSKVH